uniref:Choline transporter-like protein n=1 Tax=Zooxanthella nutricula TaxID=1333877 RepID=A0A6V0D1F1_9DINO
MSRAAARNAVREQYKFFTATEEEAFSVFGRAEVKGINRIRQVTDTHCLVAFVVVVVVMLWLDAQASWLGNPRRLSQPIDFRGKLCGYDEEVKEQKLGYHPNPLNDMLVCVKACPKTAGDGNFTLPDGPQGKDFERPAYPTSKIYGQLCLPLDLDLAKQIIATKSTQSEMYKALGVVFTSRSVILVILMVPLVTACVFIIALLFVPTAASVVAFSTTAVVLALVGMLMDLDQAVLAEVPLYHETHPLMLKAAPYIRNGCYLAAVVFLCFLVMYFPSLARSHRVFEECLAAIINKNVFITVFASLAISLLRILFILHVCSTVAYMMSITNPVQVKVLLFGEHHWVERVAWSPLFLKGLFFYTFGTYWVLEFMAFCNKYITAQVLCHTYFSLKALNSRGEEIRHGQQSPVYYAVTSLCRYHLGSVALGALLAFPCRTIRFFMSFFVPDRPNLQNSLNQQFRIAYYLFYPLIRLDLEVLRFFKDSVWVMLPLKGYKYMDAARRAEGLLNRCRGKIPNLTKFTGRIDAFINISVGLTSLVWTFFLFRERRHGKYHEVEEINAQQALGGLFIPPEHSPLLALPVMTAFGFWVGSGMLHLVSIASETLTICYCIDVEMAGGTETDALYVPQSLKDCYKDLGGGESERELSELIEADATGL